MPKWVLFQICKGGSVLKISRFNPPYQQTEYEIGFDAGKKSCPFMIKILKLGIEVNCVILIKGIYNRLTANIIFLVKD